MALTGSTIASTYLKLLRANSDTMGADATASYIQDSADTDSALSISTTRVGIGIAAPAATLDVEPSGGVSGNYAARFTNNHADGNGIRIYTASAASNEYPLVVKSAGQANVLVCQADGLVGIGTAAPEAELEILASGTTDLFIRNTTEAVNEYSRLVFLSGASGAGDTERVATIKALVESDGGALEGQLLFRTNSGDGETTKMTILADGNVGINETSPAHKLDVDGGIVEQGGVLKENLLTNSGFDVWSNSTLLEATGGEAPVTSGANAALTNNLLTNGGFDSGTSSWTAISSTLSNVGSGQTGNMLRITSDSGSMGHAYQDITTVVGKLYLITYYIDIGTATTAAVWVGTTGDSDSILASTDTDTTTATSLTNAQHVFEATATTTRITLVSRDSVGTDYSEFDTVAVYEVTPGCVAGDILGPDGWGKDSTLDLWRQHNDGGTLTKDGSFYALKTLTGGANRTLYGNYPQDGLAEMYQRYNGRTLTMGAWVKTSTASHCKLRLYDGSDTDSAFHTGGGAWEWLEVTDTMSASATHFRPTIFFAIDATVAYVSQPMLVFGSSIGEGNYTRPQGEIVWMESMTRIQSALSPLASDDKVLNLEAMSEGKVPKGIKAVHLRCTALNNPVATGQGINYGPTSTDPFMLSVNPVVAAIAENVQGWVTCDSNGDIYQSITEAGNTITGQYCDVRGVELR